MLPEPDVRPSNTTLAVRGRDWDEADMGLYSAYLSIEGRRRPVAEVRSSEISKKIGKFSTCTWKPTQVDVKCRKIKVLMRYYSW